MAFGYSPKKHASEFSTRMEHAKKRLDLATKALERGRCREAQLMLDSAQTRHGQAEVHLQASGKRLGREAQSAWTGLGFDILEVASQVRERCLAKHMD